MKKMKKTLALILGLALVMGMLSGCGNKQAEETKAPAAAASDAGESKTADKETAAAGTEGTAAGPEGAAADTDWPTGSVSIIVPASAGGGTDLLARVLADKLTAKLGQSFVVVNVTGAGGSNGTNQVYESAADGSSILFYHNAILVNSLTGVTDYSYADFVPGPHVVTDAATGFYVKSDAPYQTYQELIDYCLAHPGEVTMGVESGSFTWLMVKSFEAATGVEFKMVDVGSNSEKCTALLGGHIDVMPNQYSTAKGYIDSGDFTALGFPTEERSAVYPDVPTTKEQNVDWLYNGYEFGFWFAPGTDPAIAAKLDGAVKELFDNNEIQDDILNLGNEGTYLSPAEYSELFGDISAQYKELFDAAQ